MTKINKPVVSGTSNRFYYKGSEYDIRLSESGLQLYKDNRFFNSIGISESDKISLDDMIDDINNLNNEINTLNNNETIYQVFEYVGTATSGQVTIPEEAAIFDLYGDGILDAIVVEADANQKPIEISSTNSSGELVLISSFGTDGTYSLDSEPTNNSCIIWYIVISDKFKQNVSLSSIVSSEKRLLSVPYLDFEINDNIIEHKTGRSFYDNTAKALSYYTHIEGTIIQIGQESVVYVRNNTSGDLADGMPVYISGAIGKLPTIALTSASLKDSSCLLGLTTHAIPKNTNGFVTIAGEVRGIDTSAFSDGEELYIGSTDGTIVNVSPDFPDFAISVGVCEYAHVNDGKILVRPGIRANNHVVFEHLGIRTSFRSPVASIGDIESGNYVNITESGVRMNGESATWDDLRFPAAGINPAGAVAPPTTVTADPWAGTLTFSASAINVIAGQAQMPHAWKEGSAIRPHIHWAPTSTGTGNVLWRLEYQISNVNGIFPEVLTTIDSLDPGDGLLNKHQVAEFPEIDMTGKTLSSIIIWKVSRIGNNAADTYASVVRFLEFDIHYQIDSTGSDEEYIKY